MPSALCCCIVMVSLLHLVSAFTLPMARMNGLRRLSHESLEKPMSVPLGCATGEVSLDEQNQQSTVPDSVKLELSALTRYKEINGDLAVPLDFVVPGSDNQWPIETWGLKLGQVVSAIKTTDDYDVYRAELEEVGFRYNATIANNGSADAEAGSGFEPGKLITYFLYSWIGYLFIDTVKIVTTGSGFDIPKLPWQ